MFRALFLIFVVLPLADIALLYHLGVRFGFLETIALALLFGALGGAIARRQGTKVIESWNRALAQGRAPEEGVVSSALLLLAGLLLLMPGFLGDVFGLALLVPAVRRLVARFVRSRFEASVQSGEVHVVSFGGPFSSPREERRHDVIDVEGEDISGSSSSSRPRLPGSGSGSGR